MPPNVEAPVKGIQGQYGIISLFDGVSSVVRILKQKLQQPPTAVILAELDENLRSLVCAEFGYRADEQWGYTADGATCCYVRDVSTVIKNDCHLLRQVVSMHPNLKWFIVGGSPCQDLTYAGPSQGLLGLVGSQSRLFFVLLCTIRTAAVRFLVENAGSMKLVHYVAFCRLLGLPQDPPNQYIWDLAKHTPLISRKRNFFRNFPDAEPNLFRTSLISLTKVVDLSLIKGGTLLLLLPSCVLGKYTSLVFATPPGRYTNRMPWSGTMTSGVAKKLSPVLAD